MTPPCNNRFMRLDSHQHFWRYNPQQHVWMTDRMDVLRRDYLPADLAPLLKTIGFDGAFGTERVMIGSDWPVCTLSGEYAAVMRIVLDYVRQFSVKVRDDILGDNCARFYGVNHSTKKPS